VSELREVSIIHRTGGRASTDDSTAITPKMDIAIARLIAGDTVTDAARAARVSRATLHRWLREDDAFQAEFNRQRRQLRERRRQRLEALAEQALDNVEREIRGGNVKASQFLLDRLERRDRAFFARESMVSDPVSLLIERHERTGWSLFEGDAGEEQNGGEGEGSPATE
jgi:hypothetical protein